MSRKYLQIIIFSILCWVGADHDALGRGAPTPECCAPCLQESGGNATAYVDCLRRRCNAGTVCPTGKDITPTLTGCCGDCIADLKTDSNGEPNLKSGSPYADCIKRCKDICPAEDTPIHLYQHLIGKKH